MNTLLIESNRAIANSLLDDNLESNLNIVDNRHEAIGNNARWATTVESGIQLNPGDQISMESCALNVKGAGSDNFMTFSGKSEVQLSDGSFKTDNKAKIKVAYYVNNNIQSNVPLPLGSTTITDSHGGKFLENFGMIDLTGKQIWGVNFIDQVYPAKPGTLPGYYRYEAFNDGWSLNKNGYFFVGLGNQDGSDIALPGDPAGSNNLEKATMLRIMGYMGWNQNVPIYGLTGTTFGQNNTDIDSTYNFNIENKDKTTFRVNQPEDTTVSPIIPAVDGGASPYYVLNKGIINTGTSLKSSRGSVNANNKIYLASHENTINNTFPSDYDNFTVASNYDDLCALPPTTFKGTYCNVKPNNSRLYCGDYINSTKINFGPFYHTKYNNIVEGLATDTKIDLRTSGRDNHYFHLLEQEIELDLGLGNLAPQRVAEIITDQMKERQPNMSEPENSIGIGAEIYLSFPDNLGKNNQKVPFNPDFFESVREKISQISSKTYFNYPTVGGLCWNSKVKYQDSTQKEGWNVVEVEQSEETGVPATRKMTGDNYLDTQAYNKYYQLMLCGNPFEWETVCRIHPMLQIAPFTAPQVGVVFEPTNYSIMAGLDVGQDVERILPGGASINYKIGNLGCFPCLLSDGLTSAITDKEDYAFKATWYEGTGYFTETGVAPIGANNYNIEYLRTSQSCIYDLPKKREVLSLSELDIIPTNIIYDGQVLLSVWNEQYEKIKKQVSTNGLDTLQSQSDDLFNSTIVDWIFGRIDDMYSYPENKSSNDIGVNETGSIIFQLTPTPLRDGTPIFLPNIYQTYRLYNGDPTQGGSSTADTTTNANEIKDILVSFDKVVGGITTTGSYMMRNMRVGYADKDSGNYTTEKNPSSLYNVGNAPANTFDPTSSGNDSKYFGLPCWSCYGEDFIQDEDNYKTAYEKGCRRNIECFRYLPQGSGFNYINAYNRTIDLGSTYLNNNFTTRPDNFSLQQIKDLWDKNTILNSGKGIGVIPLFYKILPTGVSNPFLLNVPFLGVVVKNQPNKNMPLPVMGEYIMLGSTPSLSQNNLSFPATTQQSNFQTNPSNQNPTKANIDVREEYITNYCGIQNYRFCSNSTTTNRIDDIILTERTPSNLEQNETILANGGKQLANGIMVGANDPLCSYDTTFNRFSFGNLHTQLFKGNGVFQLASFGPNSNPEAVERTLKAETSAFSQQVQLPNGYFQKIDDDTASWNAFQSNLDKYIPGRLTAGGQGLKPIQIQSIEGNVIERTFSVFTNGPGINPNTPTDVLTGDNITNNFEPAGMSKYYYNNTANPANVVFCGNPLYMSPYNGTQYNHRLLNSRKALENKEFTEETFLYPPTLRSYAYVRGDSNPYLFNSAQSGIGFTGLSIPKTNNTDAVLGPVDYTLFEGSMFSKLGFSLNQFRPVFSQVQTQFNHTLFNKYLGKDKSAFQAFSNMVYPITTNSVNSTSSMPGAVNGFGTLSENSDKSIPNNPMPMFNLGQALVPSAQTATSDFIIAENLPTKLSFPYLVLRSNISTPCSFQYMGGPNGSQLLPAVSYLMTSYSSDDYFYNYRSDLVFTVDRPFVLTELISSIHFPNGQLANDVLGENSAVIYRIDFLSKERNQ